MNIVDVPMRQGFIMKALGLQVTRKMLIFNGFDYISNGCIYFDHRKGHRSYPLPETLSRKISWSPIKRRRE